MKKETRNLLSNVELLGYIKNAKEIRVVTFEKRTMQIRDKVITKQNAVEWCQEFSQIDFEASKLKVVMKVSF